MPRRPAIQNFAATDLTQLHRQIVIARLSAAFVGRKIRTIKAVAFVPRD
jgi:hypothetical protein